MSSFPSYLSFFSSYVSSYDLIYIPSYNPPHTSYYPTLYWNVGPGAGKGTQCEKLSKEFGISHLSAGELLRQERIKPTANGQLIDEYLREGKIVPVEISLNLLKNEIYSLAASRYLIDGFPRNWDNLNGNNDNYRYDDDDRYDGCYAYLHIIQPSATLISSLLYRTICDGLTIE